MPVASLGPEARDWLNKNCTRSEQEDVAEWLQDLRVSGLDRSDADLVKLAQGVPVGTTYTGLTVNCFIVPLRVSAAFRKARLIWLGVLETASGPSVFRGRLDLVALWDVDPTVMALVAAETQILAVAKKMYSSP